MNKKYFSILILFFLSLLPINSMAFSIFAGTGDAYAWPAVYRIEISQVELGMYNNSIGLTKVFEKNQYYADFGVGLSRQGTNDLGFVAAVGYHNKFWKVLGFKADWSTFGTIKGYLCSSVTIGFTFNF